jgi:hypothetical protein
LLNNQKNHRIVEEEISANLFRGLEGVGGKIFLTNNLKILIIKVIYVNIIMLFKISFLI